MKNESLAIGSASSISARMDRLPTTPYLWILVFLISLGGFFEIYDLVFTGYIAPGMAKSGLFATTTETFFGFKGIGAFIAVTFAGLFVGTFGLGFLSDRYGRRSVFTVSLIWYSIGSAIMALQTTSEGVLLWRFITGIGVGIEIVTIDVYITELVPHHMRGRAMAFNQAVMFCAAPVAAILSFWLVPLSPLGFDGWRWVVMLGSAGAVVVWFIRRAVPESPRWLAYKGRIADAERVLEKIESKVAAQYGGTLPPSLPPIAEKKREMVAFSAIWKAPYRSRIIMLLVFNFFQAFAFYGFNNWVPTLLIGQGITVTKSLLYAFVIATASPIGPLLSMMIADKLERKWLIVYAAFAVIVFGMLFSQSRDVGPLIVLGILISLSGSALSVAYHAYQTELFPTGVRARAAGLVYSFSRIGASMSGFIIAFFLRDFGVVGVFAAISAAMLICMAVIGIFGSKTNGRRLEEISE
ncbi:MFS transporter [Glaciimonas sp. PCH181]|uniref:MFS transporter n=1 Tax=Glaciimonas sp. PCH181 TaxID=2133943 RepID=UPI000D342322|nr:MFS transporter [Glaciimonas sp. PCH181]PUA19117.1 MFS transporter [Glaciimonas sp. PCH181]